MPKVSQNHFYGSYTRYALLLMVHGVSQLHLSSENHFLVQITQNTRSVGQIGAPNHGICFEKKSKNHKKTIFYFSSFLDSITSKLLLNTLELPKRPKLLGKSTFVGVELHCNCENSQPLCRLRTCQLY